MTSYVHLENKTTFFIIYSNLLLLNLQMCQIILNHLVFDHKGNFFHRLKFLLFFLVPQDGR